MSLNLSKCEHLIVTNKQNPIKSFYKLNDQILRQVSKQNIWELRSTKPYLGKITSLTSAIKQTQPVHSYKET